MGVKVQGLSDVTSDAGCRVMCELRMRRAPFCLLAEVRLKDLHLRSDRCRLPTRSGFRGLLPKCSGSVPLLKPLNPQPPRN